MRKIFLAFFAATALILSSCSKDDDDGFSLIGKWDAFQVTLTDGINTETLDKTQLVGSGLPVYEFTKDGNVSIYANGGVFIAKWEQDSETTVKLWDPNFPNDFLILNIEEGSLVIEYDEEYEVEEEEPVSKKFGLPDIAPKSLNMKKETIVITTKIYFEKINN